MRVQGKSLGNSTHRTLRPHVISIVIAGINGIYHMIISLLVLPYRTCGKFQGTFIPWKKSESFGVYCLQFIKLKNSVSLSHCFFSGTAKICEF